MSVGGEKHFGWSHDLRGGVYNPGDLMCHITAPVQDHLMPIQSEKKPNTDKSQTSVAAAEPG